MSASIHPPETTVMVEDLDTFVSILMDWHAAKVKTLEHMVDIPEGSEVTINDGMAKILEGDYRDGFILGLTLSLMELGTLPFICEQVPSEVGKILDTPA